ncbi:Trypsin-1 [Bulinus truncatus]|nr:Trypsin-1 [Bulinus truncatus]
MLIDHDIIYVTCLKYFRLIKSVLGNDVTNPLVWWDLSEEFVGEKAFRSSKAAHCLPVVVNQEYKRLYDDWTIDYDIAIFKVSTAVPTNNYISAVCLPNEGWFEGEKAIVAGWGTLTAGGDSPYKLHQVQKPIKSRETCEQRYGVGSISPRMLCAGLPQGGVDSCQGDSGGPLYTYRENRWTLTGIVSWGYGCAEAGRPGVYADVIELKDWVNSIIN